MNTKKVWETPVLESLDVSKTLEGKGITYIDVVSPSDLDVSDTPPVS